MTFFLLLSPKMFSRWNFSSNPIWDSETTELLAKMNIVNIRIKNLESENRYIDFMLSGMVLRIFSVPSSDMTPAAMKGRIWRRYFLAKMVSGTRNHRIGCLKLHVGMCFSVPTGLESVRLMEYVDTLEKTTLKEYAIITSLNKVECVRIA